MKSFESADTHACQAVAQISCGHHIINLARAGPTSIDMAVQPLEVRDEFLLPSSLLYASTAHLGREMLSNVDLQARFSVVVVVWALSSTAQGLDKYHMAIRIYHLP